MKLSELILGVGVVLGTFTVVALVVAIICGIGNNVRFPVDLADIEQLRADASKSTLGSNEDIYGQVVEINRLIARNQARNKIFLLQLTVPNGWDEIPLIELKQ